MKKSALLVIMIMVVSSSAGMAWGPMDPTDKMADPDNDKLGNLEEYRAGTNPLVPDTDGGGCPDGWEVEYGLDPTDPLDDTFDSDNDYWSNLREYLEGTNPRNPNTDNDMYPVDSTDPDPLKPNGGCDELTPRPPPGPDNPMEPDTDEDGLPDIFEPRWGTDPYNWDSDGDGLRDGLEYYMWTDPNDRDTDDDGLLDGQEVMKEEGDTYYTGTNPRKADTDGDGVGDYDDDIDSDLLPNGDEWKYVFRGKPVNWTNPRCKDTDHDNVWDGLEVAGNPANKDQTSDPLKADSDGDRLMDDIDPHTWDVDFIPHSRIASKDTTLGMSPFPTSVLKGVPFNIEARVEYNTTEYTEPGTGAWVPIEVPMVVQVYLEQDGRVLPISDPSVTGTDGVFKISCTIGDDVRAGLARLVITTSIHRDVAYLPMVWDDVDGNHLP